MPRAPVRPLAPTPFVRALTGQPPSLSIRRPQHTSHSGRPPNPVIFRCSGPPTHALYRLPPPAHRPPTWWKIRWPRSRARERFTPADSAGSTASPPSAAPPNGRPTPTKRPPARPRDLYLADRVAVGDKFTLSASWTVCGIEELAATTRTRRQIAARSVAAHTPNHPRSGRTHDRPPQDEL